MKFNQLIDIVRTITKEPIEITLEYGGHEKQIDLVTENGILVYIEIKTTCYPRKAIKYASDNMSIDDNAKDDVTIECNVFAMDDQNNDMKFSDKTQIYLNGLADKMIHYER
jgi:hypothetical protein